VSADLNGVNLRNAPPTRVNYVERIEGDGPACSVEMIADGAAAPGRYRERWCLGLNYKVTEGVGAVGRIWIRQRLMVVILSSKQPSRC
jgi:hypothetical protein